MCDRLSTEVRALQKERAAGAEVGDHLGYAAARVRIVLYGCLGKYPAAGAPDLTASAEKRAAGYESTGEQYEEASPPRRERCRQQQCGEWQQ